MITIKEVTTRKTLKKFVDFQNILYKDSPYYVPGLRMDEINTLRKDKNTAFEYCDTIFFLAYQNEVIVGRIGVILSHKSNEKWGQRNARFTHFDFIDDFEVSKALMDSAEAWAKIRNLEKLHGPLGFTDMDHQGMLVEGFEEQDMMITIYNYPYYIDHMTKLGYEKDADWVEYQVTLPSAPVEKITRVSALVKRRYDLRLIEFTNKKEIMPWAKPVFQLLNEAYSPLYGSVLLSDKQIDDYVKTNFGFVNPDFIKIVVDRDDQLVGFAITMPSLSKSVQKSRGRLLPFGFIPILRAIKKNDILDLYLIAVKPELQGLGINAIMIESLAESARNYGI
ncbi:MAG: hypothetical protein PF505_01335, partial [Vallitaleaceae bacterium]|nr:hypothetical protein [Vallitaleaceae bacterium]